MTEFVISIKEEASDMGEAWFSLLLQCDLGQTVVNGTVPRFLHL